MFLLEASCKAGQGRRDTSVTMLNSGTGNRSAAKLAAWRSQTRVVRVHVPVPLGSGIPAGMALPSQIYISAPVSKIAAESAQQL